VRRGKRKLDISVVRQLYLVILAAKNRQRIYAVVSANRAVSKIIVRFETRRAPEAFLAYQKSCLSRVYLSCINLGKVGGIYGTFTSCHQISRHSQLFYLFLDRQSLCWFLRVLQQRFAGVYLRL
jgi:hypothetical protein